MNLVILEYVLLKSVRNQCFTINFVISLYCNLIDPALGMLLLVFLCVCVSSEMVELFPSALSVSNSTTLQTVSWPSGAFHNNDLKLLSLK